ncbi:Type II secretion system (T2SS), protein F [uncultured archaeon]|nr:Type II secretion system (T2SS), protein F [uncultured archaeon]
MVRVALMLIPLSLGEKLAARYRGVSTRLAAVYPGLRYDLINAQIPVGPESYAFCAGLSAAIWAVLAAIFVLVVVKVRGIGGPLMVLGPLLGFLLVWIIFFLLHIRYPKLLSNSVAEKIDRGLLFATRDMLIQISSGIPLFGAMANVADGDYGQVSLEFRKVVNEVRSGTALSTALENMAVSSQSKYLKKTVWQLITAMRSGANLTTALKGIIKLLVDNQLRSVKAYNAELNFIVLIYLMVAAVLPTIGTTVLVIFSVFGVLGVTPEIYTGLVASGMFVQCLIIGYVNMRRPRLYE